MTPEQLTDFFLLLAVVATCSLVSFFIGMLHGQNYYWPSVLAHNREREELRTRLEERESPEWQDGGGI